MFFLLNTNVHRQLLYQKYDAIEHFQSNDAIITDINEHLRRLAWSSLVVDFELDVSHSQAYNLVSLSIMMCPMWRDQTAPQLISADDS